MARSLDPRNKSGEDGIGSGRIPQQASKGGSHAVRPIGGVSAAKCSEIRRVPHLGLQGEARTLVRPIGGVSAANCREIKNGGASRSRTGDLLHAMQALYQLSYGPIAIWLSITAKLPRGFRKAMAKDQAVILLHPDHHTLSARLYATGRRTASSGRPADVLIVVVLSARRHHNDGVIIVVIIFQESVIIF